jgi:hypothetical protein
MKRLIFAVFVVFAFVSCETRYYTVTIKNDSSKSVTYTYDDITDTLAVSGSKEYQVKAYTQPPKNISVPGAMSIQVESLPSGEELKFTDVASIDIHVLNTLDTEITLTADNYIDNNGTTSLIVPAKSEINTAKIYTKTPRFKVLSEYAISIEWKIENYIMYVTI